MGVDNGSLKELIQRTEYYSRMQKSLIESVIKLTIHSSMFLISNCNLQYLLGNHHPFSSFASL